MGVWRDVVIGMKMSRDVGPSRRDRSPSQGWSHRKGPGQWYVKRQVDLVLVWVAVSFGPLMRVC